MGAKYINGQKVEIIHVNNQHLHSKYHHLEKYVSQSGVVVSSNWLGATKAQNLPSELDVSSYYLYTVLLDKGDIELSAQEDALEAIK